MKFILIKRNPFDNTLINNIEAKFMIKIPKDLKRYYLKYGNSRIKTCELKTKESLTDVSEMISIDPNAPLSFYKVMEHGRETGLIPENLYPFAHDSGGNFYFWDSRNEHIYLIFDDEVDNPIEICKSMKDFFKLMKKSK